MAVGIPSNPRDEEVDMAPMIDMVFLLLVFFMVSSHLQSEEYIKMEIPKAVSAKIPEDRSDRMVVSVDESGNLFFGAIAIDEDGLLETLKTRNEAYVNNSGGNNRLKLFLRAPSTGEFKEVRKVMKMAAEAGIVDIIFATHEDLENM